MDKSHTKGLSNRVTSMKFMQRKQEEQLRSKLEAERDEGNKWIAEQISESSDVRCNTQLRIKPRVRRSVVTPNTVLQGGAGGSRDQGNQRIARRGKKCTSP